MNFQKLFVRATYQVYTKPPDNWFKDKWVYYNLIIYDGCVVRCRIFSTRRDNMPHILKINSQFFFKFLQFFFTPLFLLIGRFGWVCWTRVLNTKWTLSSWNIDFASHWTTLMSNSSYLVASSNPTSNYINPTLLSTSKPQLSLTLWPMLWIMSMNSLVPPRQPRVSCFIRGFFQLVFLPSITYHLPQFCTTDMFVR